MSITPIRGVEKSSRLEKFRQCVEDFKAEIPLQIELAATQARVRREKYKAYLREGFTDAQALELVKAEIT